MYPTIALITGNILLSIFMALAINSFYDLANYLNSLDNTMYVLNRSVTDLKEEVYEKLGWEKKNFIQEDKNGEKMIPFYVYEGDDIEWFAFFNSIGFELEITDDSYCARKKN